MRRPTDLSITDKLGKKLTKLFILDGKVGKSKDERYHIMFEGQEFASFYPTEFESWSFAE